MQFRTSTSEDDSSVNLTPLIDVVFLLLIFFMVSTTFDTTSELKIELPEASAEQPVTPEKLILSIDPKGYFHLNGRQLKNQSADLLQQELLRVLGDNRELPVVIQSDATSPVQSLVTAMDTVGQLGIRQVSLATTKITR